jgi:hypothetical protein
MSAYFIRRLLLVPLTFLAITFLVYAILRIAPGGPIEQAEAAMKLQAARGEAGGSGGGLSNRTDLMLDSTPVNNPTAAAQALWMGVPVLTLAGQTRATRLTSSVLAALGRTDWIAQHPQQLLALAQSLAQNLPELQHTRSELRSRVERSDLCQPQSLVSALEALYTKLYFAPDPEPTASELTDT